MLQLWQRTRENIFSFFSCPAGENVPSSMCQRFCWHATIKKYCCGHTCLLYWCYGLFSKEQKKLFTNLTDAYSQLIVLGGCYRKQIECIHQVHHVLTPETRLMRTFSNTHQNKHTQAQISFLLPLKHDWKEHWTWLKLIISMIKAFWIPMYLGKNMVIPWCLMMGLSSFLITLHYVMEQHI